MTYTNRQARELGTHRGYVAADYAANVAGQPVRSPVREDEPAMTDDAWAHFADGWDAGVEAFEIADADDEPADEPADPLSALAETQRLNIRVLTDTPRRPTLHNDADGYTTRW